MNNKKVTNIIINYLKSHTFVTVGLIVAIIGVVITSLLPPQIFKLIIDNYIIYGVSKSLFKIAIYYFLSLMMIGVLNFIKEVLLTVCGQGIIGSIRKSMMKKKNYIYAEYFAENSTGTIASIFINDVDAIASMFTGGIISMIIDLLKIIGIIISIWIFSYKLALLILFFVPLIYTITRIFQKKMLKAQLENRVQIAKVNNHIPESIQNIEIIKAFCKEEYMERKYDEYIENSYKAKESINFYDSVFSPIILVIKSVVITILVILCSKSINALGISIGMLAAAIDLISNIFKPIENVGMELQKIQQAIAGVKRVDEYFKIDEITCKNEDFCLEKIKDRSVKFENVSFTYNDGNRVIKDLSFIVSDNQSAVFMGRTGAGKSTIFKLIMGLLERDCGDIRIGGFDINEVPNSFKRQVFGYVEQSFHFVDGTIKDQITLKDESISDIYVVESLKFVGLYQYVTTFEMGIYSVAEAYMFSQGQQQLLSIARAVVTNPPIILLDEITANLDSETEKNIIDVLIKAGKDRTLLSISHRLAEALKCDMIIKIQND